MTVSKSLTLGTDRPFIMASRSFHVATLVLLEGSVRALAEDETEVEEPSGADNGYWAAAAVTLLVLLVLLFNVCGCDKASLDMRKENAALKAENAALKAQNAALTGGAQA